MINLLFRLFLTFNATSLIKVVYFVAETKNTFDKDLLREVERMKIECGKRHFALFNDKDVEYRHVVKVADLY